MRDNPNQDRQHFGGDPLVRLYRKYKPEQVHVRELPWLKPDAPASCWSDIYSKAEKVLFQFAENPDLPMDASVATWISPDGLSAWCIIFPPLQQGQDITYDELKSAIGDQGVKLGLNPEALDGMMEGGMPYLKLTQIATGLAPEDGVDGSVEVIVRLDDAPGPVEDEFGKVDFKELGWLTNVKAGDKLCRVILPTSGRDGFTVKGHRLHAKAGRPAPYISGEHTEYTEDGQYLIASVDGRLVKKGARYAVTQTVTIPGNVDYSTGNITSNCTVVVMGDVFPDFKVTAHKDIIVYGTVDGGTLEAGGDICVYGGVLASNQGVIRAGGNLKCKFMEYGNAHVGGNAYFENLIHSNVHCEGDIYVLSGRGIVIGGALTAMGNIAVTTVGNRANCPTELTVGPTEDFVEHKRAVAIELEAQLDRCNKITVSIEKIKSLPDIPDTAAEKCKQLEAALPIERIKVQRLQSEYQDMEDREGRMTHHRITVNRAFPHVRVKIVDNAMILEEEMGSTNFYYKEGEVRYSHHWADGGR